ncbi:unnamed protein product [Paramecium sonneborni]|uniref:Uncharacterized protein n=1 Tax=Paramecium sonneborni TaxID=65129 RepID=A0A8S1QTF1_9CILI|nr:unnamed protein product [Paramecium sonneborni]
MIQLKAFMMFKKEKCMQKIEQINSFNKFYFNSLKKMLDYKVKLLMIKQQLNLLNKYQ